MKQKLSNKIQESTVVKTLMPSNEGQRLPERQETNMIMLESESEVAQSCTTLFDPMDGSLPRSSIHGIFQAKVREWVAISFSRGSSQPRDQTWVSHIVGRHFTIWATREVMLIGKQYDFFNLLPRGPFQIIAHEEGAKKHVWKFWD